MSAANVLDAGNTAEIEDVNQNVNHIDDNQNGMDDLFGDDEDDEEEIVDDNNNNNNNSNKISGIDNDEDSDSNDFIENDEDNQEGGKEDNNESDSEDIRQADIVFQRHPKSHLPQDNHALNFPLPRFLFVDPEPFTPNLFEKQILKDINNAQILSQSNDENSSTIKSSIQFKKLQLTNTVRWRYAKTNDGNLFKQSNANIVEWEDGSLSLKLGNEFFDIKLKSNEDNLLSFKNGELLMSLIKMDKSIQVLPPSMKSKAHKFLASTITKNMKLKKSKKINTIVTNEDPELKAREIEKAHKEIEKARKRQLMKLQLEEEESERRSSSNNSNRRNYNNYEMDEDDEDDIDIGEGEGEDEEEEGESGFIVDDDNDDELNERFDDDELDKAAARLKQVKREGADKYKKSIPTGDDGEDGNDDDDDDEEGAVVRKKRKIVLNEDDD